MTLAALATVANPDLEVESLCPPSGSDEDFIWTGVLDARSARWSVLAAKNPAGEIALEKQEKVLSMLANYRDAHRLPFEVPRFEGKAAGQKGMQAVVYRQLPGNPLDLNEVSQNPDLAYNLGKSIAALHEIPTNLVEHVGLPSSNVQEIRQSLRSNLSRAVATGMVPPTLQARWEQALDEDAWWHFHPTFVHGSLGRDTVLVADSRVMGVIGFAEVSVGDPARDLAWLVSEITDTTGDRIFDAYHLGRAEGADSYLRSRVDLYVELALIDWLNWGVSQNNPAIIADAGELLDEQLRRLDGDFSLTGNPLFSSDTDTIPLDTATSPGSSASSSSAQIDSPPTPGGGEVPEDSTPTKPFGA